MEEVPGSEKFFPAQLVFLALGFLGPESELIKALEVKQDARSNIQTPNKVSRSNYQVFRLSFTRACRNTRRASRVSLLREIADADSRSLYGESSEQSLAN
jgi:NADPH-dependent glutamate synthase beta subunit-like oxidoreductase